MMLSDENRCYYHEPSGAAMRFLPVPTNWLVETNQVSGFLCVGPENIGWTEVDRETYDRLPGKVRKVSRVFFVGPEWNA